MWNGWQNATPTPIVLSDKWPVSLPDHLTLKDIALSLSDAVVVTERRTRSIYLPVRPKGSTPSGKISILLRTNRSELMDLLKKGDGAPTDDISRVATLLPIFQKTFVQTEVTGMVESDFNVSNSLKKTLRKALPALVSDFSVIVEGEAPSVTRGLWLLAAAAGLFAAAVLPELIKREDRREPPILKQPE